MVRLEAGLSLFSVVSGDDVCGITKNGEGDQFVLTTSRIIAVFKTQDPKPIQSWSTKASSPFTCASVYNPVGSEYIALVNHKQIYKWTSDVSDPFKVKSTPFKTPIYGLVPVAKQPPLVLMSSGLLTSLYDAEARPKEIRDGPIEDGEEIMDAWLWQKEEASVVCLTKRVNDKDDALSLLLLPFHREEDAASNDTVRIRLDPPASDAKLITASFTSSGSTAVVYTLWDGGRLCCTCLTDQHLRGSKDGQSMQCVVKVFIPGTDDRLKIAAVDKSHIAVAGLQKVSPSEEARAMLAIWDTTYGTLQAHRALTLPEDDNGCPSYLGLAHQHLIVATSKAVTLHRYECSEGTLAASVGKLGNHLDQDQDLPLIGLKWTDSEGSKSKRRKGDSNTDGENQSESKTGAILETLLNLSKPSSTQYTTSVNKFLKVSASSALDSTAATLILRNFVQRVEEDPQFWAAIALHNLIAKRVIAASSCPQFLALLARKREASLLMDCLTHMHDIPELTLAQCLQVFLSVEEDKLPICSDTRNSQEETPKKPSTEEAAISEERRVCINRVLSKPFTDSFLLDAVKHMQFKEVLLLLRYLHFLLTHPPSADDETKPEVTMDTVVDWIGIILDAHFAQLVLVPEVRPLLTELQQAVKLQVDFSTELISIQSLLHHANTTKSPVCSESASSKQSYSIEVLKF